MDRDFSVMSDRIIEARITNAVMQKMGSSPQTDEGFLNPLTKFLPFNAKDVNGFRPNHIENLSKAWQKGAKDLETNVKKGVDHIQKATAFKPGYKRGG
jgi:hypothetical protein